MKGRGFRPSHPLQQYQQDRRHPRCRYRQAEFELSILHTELQHLVCTLCCQWAHRLIKVGLICIAPCRALSLFLPRSVPESRLRRSWLLAQPAMLFSQYSGPCEQLSFVLAESYPSRLSSPSRPSPSAASRAAANLVRALRGLHPQLVPLCRHVTHSHRPCVLHRKHIIWYSF